MIFDDTVTFYYRGNDGNICTVNTLRSTVDLKKLDLYSREAT